MNNKIFEVSFFKNVNATFLVHILYIEFKTEFFSIQKMNYLENKVRNKFL